MIERDLKAMRLNNLNDTKLTENRAAVSAEFGANGLRLHLHHHWSHRTSQIILS